MNTSLKHIILAAGILLVLSLCIAFGAHAYFFFANELRNENISETVRIGNRTYTIEKGVVLSGGVHIRGMTALRALRVAYAKTLAKRSPLLGLEGTDPDALRANTTLLKETVDEISLLQKTGADAGFVRNALYPVDFLYALSSLESARQQFIGSGSELDLHAYQQSFDSVFKSGIQDSRKLLDAFIYETRSGDSPKIVGFSGTITATSSRISLASIPDALTRIEQGARERSLCLSGITRLCPALSLPKKAVGARAQQSREGARTPGTYKTHIASILRSVAATSTYDKLYAPVQLERSACLASLPPPYNMEASILLRKNYDLFHYLDDMYFIPTAGKSGPVPEYVRDEYGLTFIKINPMTFYLCPYLVEDVAVAHATLQTVTLARSYSDIPNSHRAALLSGVPSSEDAIAYIQEAAVHMQREPLPAGYTQGVLSLSLMFTQKSAGLDAVVAQIAYINSHDLKLAKEGVPFDVRAETLFYTHTAAPSLFLFHQIEAQSPLATTTADDKQQLMKKFKPYSNLRLRFTDDEITREIRGMVHAEKTGL